MGRASRLKPTKTAIKQVAERTSPDMFFKRGKGEPRIVSEFWIWLAMECSELAWKYPNMKAIRNLAGEAEGEWRIIGDSYGAQAFRDLAIMAGQKLGWHGGPHELLNKFLSHMHGDDISMYKEKPRDWKEVDFLTTNNDGTPNEFHMGRQKHAGGELHTDAFDRAKSEPMEVPKPIVPAVNATGPKGVQ